MISKGVKPGVGDGLGAWLEALGDKALRIDEPMAVEYEATALQHALDTEGRYPPIWVRSPRLPSGEISPFGLVTNLTASREQVCSALGLEDHRRAAAWWAERQERRIEPMTVAAADAPVRETVLEGVEVDLRLLPATVQHRGNPGPYLTAAHATTCDPESGIDNSAIQRCWLKDARAMSWFPYPNSHKRAQHARLARAGRGLPGGVLDRPPPGGKRRGAGQAGLPGKPLAGCRRADRRTGAAYARRSISTDACWFRPTRRS